MLTFISQATTQQQVNEMSFIRMLPHDQIRSAMQGKSFLIHASNPLLLRLLKVRLFLTSKYRCLLVAAR